MYVSGRALHWLLREGTRPIVVLGSINLPAGPARVASEIAALPIEPIADENRISVMRRIAVRA